MATLKFSRDRRGYEHFYLVQPSNRGKGRPRVLYWFRTPPNIKIGRPPFDPAIRRALEIQNPDVEFDWETIIHTPIPPPMEPELWRERRRVERVLRAAEAEEADSIADASEPSSQSEVSPQLIQAIDEPHLASPAVEVDEVGATTGQVTTSNLSSAAPPARPEGGLPRQGRRRRRRRGRRKPQENSRSGAPVIQDSGEPGDEKP